jgi:hypothetical protein
MQMLEKINQEIEGMIYEIEMQEPISITGKIFKFSPKQIGR